MRTPGIRYSRPPQTADLDYADSHVTAQLSKDWRPTKQELGEIFIDWTFPFRMKLADGSSIVFQDYGEMHVYIKTVCLSYQRSHREPIFAK